ncbi:Nramp family divalent metal transporter [Streptomyces arenae]|uniref:Nramp family divalent metal transporter n=1 Tax=Streptomyces arenae TaxID=29301 RepID=UPI00265911E9|nr:Nramp family divalent metal transporter [Streptomyces arenae]MCG7205132.1 Nramp family divalent metal transporter [Streptomyces arenae]
MPHPQQGGTVHIVKPPRSRSKTGARKFRLGSKPPTGFSTTLLGPAFVAAIAYVDPGNFAANVQAGATFGPLLLWVVVAANLVAMLVQYLSAKLGLATGLSLPQLCRREYPRPVVIGLWLQAEAVVMMTDLAEVVGGAIALNILFGLPLPVGGIATAAVSLAMMPMRSRGRRRFELLMTVCLTLLLGVFLGQVVASDGATRSLGGLVPHLAGGGSLLTAGGIVGATVMPHVIYLHSALTSDQRAAVVAAGSADGMADATRRRSVLWHMRIDVLIALGVAGVVNTALLIAAATSLYGKAPEAGDSLNAAYDAFGNAMGATAAAAFAIALLISGLAGTSVGIYTGQIVMGGFLRRTIPVLLRRLLTVAPALGVLWSSISPTDALVLSQVVLSFGIPFALLPLILLTRDKTLMGPWVNRATTTACAWFVGGLITVLNVWLLAQLVM